MKEITESNRLIAGFMGVPKCGRCEDCGAYQYSPAVIYQPEDMKYHTSWDWLIPVWVKIREIIEDNIDRTATLCWYDNHQKSISHAILNYEIKIVFDRIVRFIQWYNQQQADK